jgi:hypothetical protein
MLGISLLLLSTILFSFLFSPEFQRVHY